MVLTHTVVVKYCTYLVVAKHVTVADDHNAISYMQVLLIFQAFELISRRIYKIPTKILEEV